MKTYISFLNGLMNKFIKFASVGAENLFRTHAIHGYVPQ